MHKQRGLSLLGLIIVGGLVVLAVIVGMKVAPSVIEYFVIQRNLKAMTASGELQGATLADVRRSFERRAQIDDIKSITARDLEVSKDGNDVVLSFSYAKTIPLFSNVSLLIDFEGSSAGN